MAFMQGQIHHDKWYEIDTYHGIFFVPCDVIGKLRLRMRDWKRNVRRVLPYTESWKPEHIMSLEKRVGYGARLSAPGYLDCTEWSVFDSADEARDYLRRDMYGDEEEAAY